MNNKFYKIGAGIGIALISLVVICIALAKNNDRKMAEAQNKEESIMSSTNKVEENVLTVEIPSSEFNEIENKTVENKVNETKKLSSKANTTDSVVKSNKNSADKKTNDNKNEEKVEEPVNKDPVFSYPVKGNISTNYAKDKLVYSNTLGEWVTHLGVDIKAPKTTVVAASADGTIKSIKNDPRYGLTVVIEHANGFSTVYSNLLTAEFVKIGEKVKAGQTIGTVGNTASFEILDESHLHFEILKNGEQIDPNMYLK
ncbi:MAG: M23 family metallopeptidase [Clostridia bacterium]|nr:M23 family metallopeptidase [Clostridia bacterium]